MVDYDVYCIETIICTISWPYFPSYFSVSPYALELLKNTYDFDRQEGEIQIQHFDHSRNYNQRLLSYDPPLLHTHMWFPPVIALVWCCPKGRDAFNGIISCLSLIYLNFRLYIIFSNARARMYIITLKVIFVGTHI